MKNNLKCFFLCMLCFSYQSLFSQTIYLRVNSNIVLPKDSIEKRALLLAINGFLAASQNNNDENTFVYKNEKLETYILLDELKGIEKSVNYKDEHFYKPYLTNLVALRDSNYLVQISYIGNYLDTAILRASIRFVAHKSKESFCFSSVLKSKTALWKTRASNNIYFHYRNKINKSSSSEFFSLARRYDAKLKIKNKQVEYYGCKDIFELQDIMGIDYKSDYNGSISNIRSVTLGDRRLVLLGNNKSSFETFDKHDLWHDRMSLILPRSKANKSIDEGCAYLYGGSWGLSWNEIFEAFKNQISSNKNSDWVDMKEVPVYFKTKEFNNSADYIVSALLIKKIEKEKGFEAVWELLNLGPSEKGNEKFYQAIEKICGVKKDKYNEFVWQLINEQ